MRASQFKTFRRRLKKTQKEMAQLLGVSLKAIHSYEQGWRTIPTHVERQLYFLVARQNGRQHDSPPCWQTLACPPEKREACPAWEFASGDLCWFINGTICDGVAHSSWQDKLKLCRKCAVFKERFHPTRRAT